MTQNNHGRPKRRFNRTAFQRILLKWHARVGIMATLFILAITVTGIILNHPQLFGIEGSNVTANWVLNHYYGAVPVGEVAAEFRPPSVPLSRVMLDLHTGKFFGLSGTVVTDIAAIALLLLVVSGVYNWIKRKKW